MPCFSGVKPIASSKAVLQRLLPSVEGRSTRAKRHEAVVGLIDQYRAIGDCCGR